MPSRLRRTKIVCTIGPATHSRDVIRELIEAGMNVARLNFSHGTHEEHAEAIEFVRSVSAELGKPVAILQDLTGPRIRIGPIRDGEINLDEGADVTLTTRDVPGTEEEIGLNYENLPREVEVGDTLLIADCNVKLEILECGDTDIRARVVMGGPLSSNKGINLPDRTIAAPSVTEKDREDLAFGIAHGVDYVALSFVRTAADVETAKQMIASHDRAIPLIAKIEKHEALIHIDEIIDAADGIMVARGDLGIETPLETLTVHQKKIIEKTNRAGKPVITATQMLMSMVDNRRPTRAEVSDVANAILDGTDALMLSEETSIGQYPVQTVEMMSRIAHETEKAFPSHEWMDRFKTDEETSLLQAICHAACEVAEDIRAACILTYTQLGNTAKAVAQHRPRSVIFAATTQETVYRQLALIWGVEPVLIEPIESAESLVEVAKGIVRKTGVVRAGERIVITEGVPFGIPTTTNSLTTVEL